MDYNLTDGVRPEYDGIVLKDMEEFRATLSYLANGTPYEGRVELQRQEGDSDASQEAIQSSIDRAYEKALGTPLNDEEFAYDFFREAAGSNLYRTTVFLHSREGQLVMRVEPEYVGGFDEASFANEIGAERGVYGVSVSTPIPAEDGKFEVDIASLAERSGLGSDNLEAIVNQVMTPDRAEGNYKAKTDEDMISYELSSFPVDLYFAIEGSSGSLQRKGNVISGESDSVSSMVLTVVPYIDSKIEDPVVVPSEQKELMDYANKAAEWLKQ